MNRVIISDIHLGSPQSKAYGWLTQDQNASLEAFLQSPHVAVADQLILAGDFLDLWVCPIDVRPPTAFDIIDAPQNAGVIARIRQLATSDHHQVIYIPGNHDMEVTPAAASAIDPRIVFGKHFDDAGIRVRHGHEGCLFNAPDPTGRQFPIGYFLTRMSATGVARGHAQVGMNLWTILQNAGEVDRVADGKPIAQAVWDVVAAAAGVSMDEDCIMPNNSRVQLSLLREMYSNVAAEWTGCVATAVQCEWDPWYDLPIAGDPRLHIVGHSHLAKTTRGVYGAYLNTGCWCGPEQTFAVTWDERDCEAGALYSWDGKRGVPRSTIERI